MNKIILLALAIILAPLFAQAGWFGGDKTSSADIAVEHARVAAGDNCVSMTVLYKGQGMEAITKASSSIADEAVLIDQRMHRDVQKIELWPGKPLRIERGNACIILRKLKNQLKAGDQFTVTLSFIKASPVSVQVKVVAAETAQPVAAKPIVKDGDNKISKQEGGQSEKSGKPEKKQEPAVKPLDNKALLAPDAGKK